MRADAPRAVVLDAHGGKETASRPRLAVGARVLLGERPQGGVLVLDDGATRSPVVEDPGGLLVAVPAIGGFRQVHVDDVVGGPGGKLGPLLRVDYVVGGRGDGVQSPGHVEVVMKRPEGLRVGHAATLEDRPARRPYHW